VTTPRVWKTDGTPLLKALGDAVATATHMARATMSLYMVRIFGVFGRV